MFRFTVSETIFLNIEYLIDGRCLFTVGTAVSDARALWIVDIPVRHKSKVLPETTKVPKQVSRSSIALFDKNMALLTISPERFLEAI